MEKPSTPRPVIYQVLPRLFGNTQTAFQQNGDLSQNGVGKFADFTSKALDAIEQMGITHVWYTGVLEHTTATDYSAYEIPQDPPAILKGKAGSPYAIKDYYDVSPDLATSVPNRMKEFEELVARTHKAGMKVIIDFVPNHVARNYHSDVKPDGVEDFGYSDDSSKNFDPNNNFYYVPNEALSLSFTQDHYKEDPAKATGNDVFHAYPSAYDWYETIKLNYGLDYMAGGHGYFEPLPDTWLKMKHILQFWAAKGVDGFRCDMAEMVPVPFWKWVIKEIKEDYSDVIFLAESYNPDNYRAFIYEGGFDYLYDKVELYDTLKNIVRHHANTDAITHVWQRQEANAPHMLRFLENHDEQRIASPGFANDALAGIPMMAISSFMHKGPVMLYFGQEVGEPANGAAGFSGDDGRTTIFDYYGVPEHQKWMNGGAFDGQLLSKEQQLLRARYIEIMKKLNAHPALREGHFFDLMYYNRNENYEGLSHRSYTFLRHLGDESLLIVVNFNTEEEKCRLKIPKLAWEKMCIESQKVRITGSAEMEIERKTTLDFSMDSELQLTIPARDYFILKLESIS